jgi:hypothetical protein
MPVDYHTQEMIYALLQNEEFDPSRADNWALKTAAKYGLVDCVTSLLRDDRVNPCASDNYALLKAIKYGHTKCVKLLLNDKRVRASIDHNRVWQQVTLNTGKKIIGLLQRKKRKI